MLKECIYFTVIFLTAAKSFVEMARYLLSQEGLCYLLSEKLNQVPLESFFGKQRMRFGYSENPKFLYETSSIPIQGSTALKPIWGNCKHGRENVPIAVDNSPLPKRPRSHSQNNYVHDVDFIINAVLCTLMTQ